MDKNLQSNEIMSKLLSLNILLILERITNLFSVVIFLGQPDDRNSEDCLLMYPENGEWNDVNCSKTRMFVCERHSEYDSITYHN